MKGSTQTLVGVLLRFYSNLLKVSRHAKPRFPLSSAQPHSREYDLREMETIAETNELSELRLPAPKTLADYDRLKTLLDVLIDEVGEDKSHTLAPLLDHVEELIEEFEASHIPKL